MELLFTRHPAELREIDPEFLERRSLHPEQPRRHFAFFPSFLLRRTVGMPLPFRSLKILRHENEGLHRGRDEKRLLRPNTRNGMELLRGLRHFLHPRHYIFNAVPHTADTERAKTRADHRLQTPEGFAEALYLSIEMLKLAFGVLTLRTCRSKRGDRAFVIDRQRDADSPTVAHIDGLRRERLLRLCSL